MRMNRVRPTVRRILDGCYKAAATLILDPRTRQLPTNPLSCGSQSANIRLINRRALALSVHPHAYPPWRRKKKKKWVKKPLDSEVTSYQQPVGVPTGNFATPRVILLSNSVDRNDSMDQIIERRFVYPTQPPRRQFVVLQALRSSTGGLLCRLARRSTVGERCRPDIPRSTPKPSSPVHAARSA